MTSYELAILWLAWIIAGGSPGPATLGIAGASMQRGRRAGLFFAGGILVGSAAWGIAAALGMGALMLANVWIFSAIRYLGAVYLLYLALKSLRAAMTPKSQTSQPSMLGTNRELFLKGTLIHATNPKAILSWGAVYAIAVSPQANWPELVWMFVFLFSGSILVFSSYAMIFSTPGIARVYRRMQRGFELAFAALFGAAAIKILTTRIVG